MIDKLYELAKLENETVSTDDNYSIFIDKFPNKIEPDKFALLIINLEEKNNQLTYKDISPLGINGDNKDQIGIKLWKISTKGQMNGPCACFNPKKDDTFIDKIANFFSSDKGIGEEIISKVLNINKKSIITEVKLLAKKTTWISLKINNKFISELDINSKIRNYILDKKGLTNTSKKGTCYLCHSKNTDIVNQFKIPKMAFGTLDKKENISMNAKDFSEYKMCSICKECQRLFNDEFSNVILTEYVTSFYGLRIIVLPTLIDNKDRLDKIKEKIKRYNLDKENIKNEIMALSKLKKDLKELSTNLEKKEKIEKEIKNKNFGIKYSGLSDFGVISDYIENTLIFSIVLFETSSSKFTIYDVVDNISKTRMSEIAQAHKDIVFKFNNSLDLIYFYQRLLKYQFDRTSKKIYDHIKKQFIDFITCLLLSNRISKENLINIFMTYVHTEFYEKDESKRDSFLLFETKKFVLLLDFLDRINCLGE